LAKDWLATLRHLEPDTVRDYQAAIDFLTKTVGDPAPLQAWHIERVVAALRASEFTPGFQAKLWMVINRFCRWGFETGRMKINPTSGVAGIPKVPQQAREVFTRDEYEAMLAMAKSRPEFDLARYMIIVGWYTGMAFKDACTLEWHNVDMERCVITLQRNKTGSEAIISFEVEGELHNELLLRLEEVKRLYGGRVLPSFPVCVKAYSANHTAEYQLRCLFRTCGIPKGKTFHNFRATMISSLVKNNASTPVAMKIMGIKTTSVFAAYATIEADQVRKELKLIK
jgi:integrase